jgi:uncharacterized HhH-GPD family protein
MTARLHLSGDERADALVSTDPLALLIGMVLDQQITIEKAFRGPADLAERLGLATPLDAAEIASTDPVLLAEAFARPPSIHRYPTSMAARVQALCQVVADEYGGDASHVWTTATGGDELRRRVLALPGFGDRKARIFVALLGKQLGVRPEGWKEASEPFGEPGTRMSVADIVDASTLAEVRLHKKEAKAAANAASARTANGRATTGRGHARRG